jgi:hypothetical protein
MRWNASARDDPPPPGGNHKKSNMSTSNAIKFEQAFQAVARHKARKAGCTCYPEVILSRDSHETGEWRVEHKDGCSLATTSKDQ